MPKSVLALALSVVLSDVESFKQNVFKFKFDETLSNFVAELLKLSLHTALRLFFHLFDEVSKILFVLPNHLLILIAYLDGQIFALKKFE